MNLQPARFSMDVLGDEVWLDGFTADETWNGWDCPYFTFEQGQNFTFEQGQRVVEAFNTSKRLEGDKVESRYDAERDVFCFFFESSTESDDFPAVEINGRKFYPIGAGCWIWESDGRWVGDQGEGLDAA